MFNEEGKLEEDPEKIKQIYKVFYEKLLKDRDPENKEEKDAQQLKEKCIELMKEYTQKKDKRNNIRGI